MTYNTSLLIGAAKQPRGPTGVVRYVAREAGVLSDSGITADIRLNDGLVHGGRVNPGGPPGKVIDRARHSARRIVTSKTKLSIGTVTREKVLRDCVLSLHVRVVAGSAFNVSQDQFDRTGRIGGFSLGNQRAGKINRVFQRQHKTKRMGILQIR